MRGRWHGRSLLALVACLLAVIVINGLNRPEPWIRWYSGPVGDWVTAPRYDVTVERAELARQVFRGQRMTTSDVVLVVVHWSVRVHAETSNASTIRLETVDGKAYAPLKQLENAQPTGHGRIPARHIARGASVFELPPDRVVGAALTVRETQIMLAHSPGVRVDDVVTDATPRVELVVLADPRWEAAP